MLTNFIFMALLCAPGVYAAARFGKRFEQTVPLCVMGTVLILFIFGLAGCLETGMPVLYGLALCFYLLAAAAVLKKRDIRGFLGTLLTPGTVFFGLACVLLTLWNHGKVASNWDEFSHWVDIVKAVTYIGDFGTNPAAESAFQNYPPAMMLLQYGLQKVCMLVKPGFGFSEWRVYFAFQVFIVSVMLPFFRDITFRQPLKLALYAAITFLAPLLFYSNLYSAVYIDPFLGILFGAGMAMIVLRPKKDTLYTAYICMVCAMLTLSKDVGFAFAVVLALAFGADQILDSEPAGRKKVLLTGPLALAAAYLPKLLWSWEVHTSGAKVSFSGKIDWAVLADVILGRDTSYRSELVKTYWDALLTKTISLGNVPLKLNYVMLMLIFLGTLYVLWRLFRFRAYGRGKRVGSVLGISGFVLVGYMVGLCVIYMFKFSEYEATRLASMERYLNIAFLGVWLMILLLLAHWVCQWCGGWGAKLTLLAALLLVVPTGIFTGFVRGAYVNQSVAVRAPYETLSAQIRRTCDGDDKIYFVSQETTGFDYWVSRFNARPNQFNGNMTWSIGEAFYDGDIWTKQTTAEEWQTLLLEQYDYVALYQINDYFLENFAQLFAEPESIETNALYRVNRETGLLDQCE